MQRDALKEHVVAADAEVATVMKTIASFAASSISTTCVREMEVAFSKFKEVVVRKKSHLDALHALYHPATAVATQKVIREDIVKERSALRKLLHECDRLKTEREAEEKVLDVLSAL